jgi:ATP-dependent DNA ligase
MKMRAPVFLGLRFDKDPKECRLEEAVPSTVRPPDKRTN